MTLFGKTALGASSDVIHDKSKAAAQFIPEVADDFAAIKMWARAVYEPCNARMAFYAQNPTDPERPGALIAQTEEALVPMGAPQEIVFPLPTLVHLEVEHVWIAVMNPRGIEIYFDVVEGFKSASTSEQDYYDGFSDPFSDAGSYVSKGNNEYSFWAVSAVEPPPPPTNYTVTLDSSPAGATYIQPDGLAPFQVQVEEGGSLTIEASPTHNELQFSHFEIVEIGQTTGNNSTLENIVSNLTVIAHYIAVSPPPSGAIIVPDDYPTIQAAINAHSPGDTIYVRNGTYYEILTLSGINNLAVLGASRDGVVVVEPDGAQNNPLTIKYSSYITIEGITLDANRAGNPIIGRTTSNGVWMEDVNAITFNDFHIRNVGRVGMEINNPSGSPHFIRISGGVGRPSIIEDCGWNGMTVVVHDVYEDIVAENIECFNVSDVGFSTYGGYGVVFKNCKSHDNMANLCGRTSCTHAGFGVEQDETTAVVPGEGALFINCEAWGNYAGFYVLYTSTTATLRGCNFHHNDSGIRSASSAGGNLIVEGNSKIVNNGADLALWGSLNFIVRNSALNVFRINSCSSESEVYSNSIIAPVFTTLAVSIHWDNGSIGNYWGNYAGVDADGDGIGDTPHVINSYNQDNYPLMEPPAEPPPPTHILTINSSPITGVQITVDGLVFPTPTTLQINEGTHIVVAPANVVVNTDTYNFVQWENGLTNPLRTITIFGNLTVSATYQLYEPPPPEKGKLDVHAFLNSQEVVAPFEVLGTTITGNTPTTIEVDAGTYTVKATYLEQPQEKTATVAEGQTIRVDFQFQIAPSPSPCFVATACYGSPLSYELDVLRHFRNRCLPRTIVHSYYRVGAYLAQFIKRRKAIKRYVREILNLFVKLYKEVME